MDCSTPFLGLLVALLPLGGFLFNALFGRGRRRLAPGVALAAVGCALSLSLVLAMRVLGNPAPQVLSAPWLSVSSRLIGHFTINVGVLLDPLSVLMLVVVTLVSFLVHLYSLGYMREDPGLPRFFLYLGLFTFSMLGLVLSPDFFQMYIFWELVGLCSYLLIGFYTTKPEANQACKKAFVVNRVGDFGMFIGILLLSYYLGTSDFAQITAHIGRWPLYGPAWLPLGGVALLLFCGAVGKSAQFPLHVWLPDAMEGPTPVSALIHAATMVVAGVYMVARAYAVFDAALVGSVNAPLVVAWVGGITCLFAATIACVQFDIKRVLAYSTLSQLGYMILALGVGGLGVTAGLFHLFTHAFFKALLFLGAGSVIHAIHSNDLRHMGGLRRSMPLTGLTFLMACLAISAIPPFAGFMSKDMILGALKESHQTGLFCLAAGVSFLTAFYIFRLYFLAFEGPSRDGAAHGQAQGSTGHADKVHESPWTMTVPLVVLAVLSCCAGFAGLDWQGHSFGSYLGFERGAALNSDWSRAQALALAHPEAVGNYPLADALWQTSTTPVAVSAVIPAHRSVLPTAPARVIPAPATPQGRMPSLASASPLMSAQATGSADDPRAFRLDYAVAVPSTLLALAGLLLALGMYRLKWLDPARVSKAFGPVHTLVYNKYYVDEAYRWALDHGYYVLSGAIAWFDRHVVDGVINGLAALTQGLGGAFRKLQTGRAQAYALAMLGGLLLLLGALKVLLP